MSPETEKNVNRFISSWNYTGLLLAAIIGLCVCVPIFLFFVLGIMGSLLRGDLEGLLMSVAGLVFFVGLVVCGFKFL